MAATTLLQNSNCARSGQPPGAGAQQAEAKGKAAYDAAYARWQERSAREDAGRQMRGLNSLPPPEKPRTGLSPGWIGKIRRF